MALLALQSTSNSFSQETTVKPLQGWLDFLVQDASLASVVNRIGLADEATSADKIAPNAQLYVWHNRFESGSAKDDSLELVAIPDQEPTGSRMMVIAILDPGNRKGIYLPWARRYVDNVPRGNSIPRYLLSTLVGY